MLHSRVSIAMRSPSHAGSALTPKRLNPSTASRECPQPDSSAASATVKLAGTRVFACAACAGPDIAAMNSAGVMFPPSMHPLEMPVPRLARIMVFCLKGRNPHGQRLNLFDQPEHHLRQILNRQRFPVTHSALPSVTKPCHAQPPPVSATL